MENGMNECYLADDLLSPELLRLLLDLRRTVLLCPVEGGGWSVRLGEPAKPVVPDAACVGLHALAVWLAAHPKT